MKRATSSGRLELLGLGLAAEDRHLGLQVGRLDVGDQPPLEATAQPLLEGGDVPRRGVGREDDLLLAGVESVEGVEELLLRPLLVGEELDVVDEQDVDGPVALAEGRHAVEADGVDQLVDELLGCQVHDLERRPLLQDLVADGVQQVGLAETDPAVEEERVVAVRRALGHRLGGGVGELVGGADDEGAEDVAGIEAAARGRRGTAGRRRLLEREQHFHRRALEAGDGAVDGRPVALLQCVQKARVGGQQQQPVGAILTRPQGAEPGGEFVRIELLLELAAQAVPVVSITHRELGHRQQIRNISTTCGKKIQTRGAT